MDSITLDLRPGYPRTFHKWFGVIVIVYSLTVAALMLTSVIRENLPLIFTTILLLGQVVANWPNTRPLRVTFDASGISGQIGHRKGIAIGWEQIAWIDVHMFAMDIRAKDGHTDHIDLGEITYEQQKTIKPRIVDLAKSKGIEVRAA